jgi:hypothetical protein
LQKAGFDDWFTVPLSATDIQEKIMNKMEFRSELFMVQESEYS